MENGTLTDLIRARRGPVDFFRLAAEMAMVRPLGEVLVQSRGSNRFACLCSTTPGNELSPPLLHYAP
jgi:hypothetical protein